MNKFQKIGMNSNLATLNKVSSTALTVFGVSITSVLLANPAQGASLTNGTGLTDPALTITADEFILANETVVTNQYSSLGVTFSPNVYYNSNNGGLGVAFAPVVAGNYFGNFDNLTDRNFDNPFSIEFSTDQTDVAFGLVPGNPGTITFTAFLNGSTVESFSTTVGFPGQFYGFTDSLFDEIQIEADIPGDDDLVIFDNIQIGIAAPATTPEPGTILGLLAVGSLGALVRRKKA